MLLLGSVETEDLFKKCTIRSVFFILFCIVRSKCRILKHYNYLKSLPTFLHVILCSPRCLRGPYASHTPVLWVRRDTNLDILPWPRPRPRGLGLGLGLGLVGLGLGLGLEGPGLGLGLGCVGLVNIPAFKFARYNNCWLR